MQVYNSKDTPSIIFDISILLHCFTAESKM